MGVLDAFTKRRLCAPESRQSDYDAVGDDSSGQWAVLRYWPTVHTVQHWYDPCCYRCVVAVFADCRPPAAFCASALAGLVGTTLACGGLRPHGFQFNLDAG